jgi:hypothetical protein
MKQNMQGLEQGKSWTLWEKKSDSRILQFLSLKVFDDIMKRCPSFGMIITTILKKIYIFRLKLYEEDLAHFTPSPKKTNIL